MSCLDHYICHDSAGEIVKQLTGCLNYAHSLSSVAARWFFTSHSSAHTAATEQFDWPLGAKRSDEKEVFLQISDRIGEKPFSPTDILSSWLLPKAKKRARRPPTQLTNSHRTRPPRTPPVSRTSPTGTTTGTETANRPGPAETQRTTTE